MLMNMTMEPMSLIQVWAERSSEDSSRPLMMASLKTCFGFGVFDFLVFEKRVQLIDRYAHRVGGLLRRRHTIETALEFPAHFYCPCFFFLVRFFLAHLLAGPESIPLIERDSLSREAGSSVFVGPLISHALHRIVQPEERELRFTLLVLDGCRQDDSRHRDDGQEDDHDEEDDLLSRTAATCRR